MSPAIHRMITSIPSMAERAGRLALAVCICVGLQVIPAEVAAQDGRDAADSTGSQYSPPGYSPAASNPPAFSSFPTPQSCGANQKLQWANNSWTCVTEGDPQVDYLAHGYWCRAWGASVRCDMPQPITAEADPTIVTKVYGRLCASYDNVVYCDRQIPTCDWNSQKLYWNGWHFQCAPDLNSSHDPGAERNGECRVWRVGISMEEVYRDEMAACSQRYGGHVNTILVGARPHKPCTNTEQCGSQDFSGFAVCQSNGC